MIGKTISHYRIVDKLGEGGMGAVYKAEDTTLNRLVALKVLSSQLAEDKEARERFIREAQAASSLNHSNITTVYELLEEEGEQYISMEYVEGKTIRDIIESGHVSIRKALDIIIQAAEALETAHNKGILHRDIKSANIMVSMEGNVKVMDFGLAHLEERSQLTRTGTTMGTLAYSSPEQLTGALVDRRSEIFSLGVVFYELLTGQLPFKSPSEGELVFEIINNEQDHPSQLRNDVPENVEAVITKMLIKKPELRYQSCAELLTDLTAIRSELETTTVQITTALPEAGKKRSRLVAIVTAAGAVIIGSIVILLAVGSGPRLRPDQVVVAAFENHTGDTIYDQYGKWAADYVIAGIEKLDFANAIPLEHSLPTSLILQGRAAAGEISDPIRILAEETSSGIAVSGGFYVLDGRTIQFHVRIRNIAGDRIIDTFDDVSGPLEQKSEVVTRLRQRILASLAARLSPGFESWAAITEPPRSIEAFNEFSEGLDIYMEDSYSVEALPHYYNAIRLDSTYVTAMLYAARSHYLIGQSDTTHMAAADSMAQILESRREGMSELNQLMLDLIKAAVIWDQPEKYRIARKGAELAPGTFWTFMAGQSAQFTGLPEEALVYFDQLDPGGAVFGYGKGADKYWNQLLYSYFHLVDWHGMLEVVEQAREHLGNPMWQLMYEAVALGAVGDMESILSRIERAESEGRDPWGILAGGTAGFKWSGFEEEWSHLFERLFEFLESQPGEAKRSNTYRDRLATALINAGRAEEAEGICSGLVEEYPDNRYYRRNLGIIAASMGDTLRARQIQDWFKRFDRPYVRGGGYEDRALIEAHLGNIDEAINLLRIAIQRGLWRVYLGSTRYQLFWSHPGFQEFLPRPAR